MSAYPEVADYERWRIARDQLLAREKAHTHEGDAIAAARRRLPMTEVDPLIRLRGPSGPTPLVDLFELRDQLIVYKHMWHAGKPYEKQCEGCTATIWDLKDATYLNRVGVSFAVVCEGPWDEVEPFREFMGYTLPWYSAYGVDHPVLGDRFGEILIFARIGERVFLTNTIGGRGTEVLMTSARLLDLTVFGRKEVWEDSPDGWPQHHTAWRWRLDGRPTPQWTRPGITHRRTPSSTKESER